MARGTKQRHAAQRRRIAVNMLKLARAQGRKLPEGARYVEFLKVVKQRQENDGWLR